MSEFRKRLHELLEPAEEHDLASRLVDVSLVLLILADVLLFVVTTADETGARGGWQQFVEYSILAIFTVEYALRLAVCDANPRYRGWRGRLRYLCTPMAMIDLVAIVPIVSHVPFLPVRVPGELTSIRLLRMGKLFRYSDSALVLGRSIVSVRKELGVIAVAMVMGLVTSGIVMNGLEGGANPEDFGSIADSMWWAAVTMTTVGYGDAVPVTVAGRFIATVMMVSGMAFFALPAGLLGAAFTREVSVHAERRRARRERRRRMAEHLRDEKLEAVLELPHECPHCGGRIFPEHANGAPGT